MQTWDPQLYRRYADERARPFWDLVARIGATEPRRVVDLGCGPGELTASLAARWPRAQVVGLDSSAEMIAKAPQAPNLVIGLGDLRDWAHSEEQADVVVSNAALQWVPGHLELLGDLVDRVSPGGWLAFQVPGNFGEPSHALRRDLAAEPAFAPHLAGIASPASHDPQVYHDRLTALGCAVEAWETTYLHVLEGEDAVFSWVSGTGARPTLEALPDPLRQEFTERFQAALRTAYPVHNGRVLLPFRRVFVVARPDGGDQ